MPNYLDKKRQNFLYTYNILSHRTWCSQARDSMCLKLLCQNQLYYPSALIVAFYYYVHWAINQLKPQVPILAYKSTLLFVVKSSKSGDLAQTLFLWVLILQVIIPCKKVVVWPCGTSHVTLLQYKIPLAVLLECIDIVQVAQLSFGGTWAKPTTGYTTALNDRQHYYYYWNSAWTAFGQLQMVTMSTHQGYSIHCIVIWGILLVWVGCQLVKGF